MSEKKNSPLLVLNHVHWGYFLDPQQSVRGVLKYEVWSMTWTETWRILLLNSAEPVKYNFAAPRSLLILNHSNLSTYIDPLMWGYEFKTHIYEVYNKKEASVNFSPPRHKDDVKPPMKSIGMGKPVVKQITKQIRIGGLSFTTKTASATIPVGSSRFCWLVL